MTAPGPSPFDLSPLWALARERFRLDPNSLHGPDHWQRVERNALHLAAATPGADLFLVRLFAVLHDSHRHNECHDPEHGHRAATWAATLNGGPHFTLPPDRLTLLQHALTYHDKGQTSPNPTTGTCWDADRLDLARVGITPSPRLMSTPAGKALAADPSPLRNAFFQRNP
jgi:uncharacterized protein